MINWKELQLNEGTKSWIEFEDRTAVVNSSWVWNEVWAKKSISEVISNLFKIINKPFEEIGRRYIRIKFLSFKITPKRVTFTY